MRAPLGQVFLVDKNILRKMVDSAEITEGEWVIELGPGSGNLTQFLLEKGAKVLAYEKDFAMVKTLKARFPLLIDDRLIIKEGDFLKIDVRRDLRELGVKPPVKFVSNIPYYITGKILRHLAESRGLYSPIFFTLQREVAERLVAKPRTKDYGFVTLLIQYSYDVQILFHISRTCFRPVPKVSSSLVRFIPRDYPPVEVEDEVLLFKVIKASFSARRKKLRRSLRTLLDRFSLERLEESLEGKISLDRRGEELTLKEFALLANIIREISQ
jgi:16S rRNA (adenine1518-N6/adenine1519-N6)-dimethyltransferase